MTGTTDLALREDTALEAHTGALAISADQVQWTSMQEAALNQLGLKNAPDGDRLVFLHVAQRTGLDPFAKQIHMLERGGKWSIQTGIDGFRVNRARAERLAGVRGILGQAVYIDAEGNEYKRWFKPAPPVGCEITYTVRDLNGTETPYTSFLRFTEYAQYKMDGKLNAKWSASPAHMLEKCTEADVYRKAFPQDFSGISFEDAAAPDGSDGTPAEPAKQRPRVTADAIRARSTVTATVVAPDVPPAPASHLPVPPEAESAGGTRTYPELLEHISARLEQLGVIDAAEKLRAVSLIAGTQVKSARGLKYEEAVKVADTLDAIDGPGPDGLLADLATKDDPREVPGEQ